MLCTSLKMRTITILLIIFTAVTVLGQQKDSSMKDKLTFTDSWFNSEGDLDGLPTLIRGRDSLKNVFETKLYNNRIEIVWEFSDKSDSGMPSNKESDFMEKVENAIVDSLERNLESVLVSVFTWNNTRTWFFYTKSTEGFKGILNDALSQFEERLPIHITVESDPELINTNQKL